MAKYQFTYCFMVYPAPSNVRKVLSLLYERYPVVEDPTKGLSVLQKFLCDSGWDSVICDNILSIRTGGGVIVAKIKYQRI